MADTTSGQQHASPAGASLQIRLRVFSTVLLAALSLGLGRPVAANAQIMDVLVIHSYDPGFAWTVSVQEGIQAALTEEREELHADSRIAVEYLDAKHYPDATLHPHLAALFEAKYVSNPPEIIISCDDDALNFLFRYRDELFPDVPVVACGLNVEKWDEELFAGRSGYTAVVERLDFTGTISLMLELHPETTEIAVIQDWRTATGRMDLQTLDALENEFESRVRFRRLGAARPLTRNELLTTLRTAEPDVPVLFLGFFSDAEGTALPTEHVVEAVSRAARAPVYSHIDTYLGMGILGGKLLSGRMHGYSTGEMAVRVLAAPDEPLPPVLVESSNRYMFDARQLERFGIPDATLPAESVIAFRDLSAFEELRPQITRGVAAIVFLVAMVVALVTLNLRRRQAQEQLERALSEKDALMQEMNHRIKNNLLMINALIRLKVDQDPDLPDLSDIQSQIDAIRIVHEKLYQTQDVTRVEMAPYLEQLLGTVFASAPEPVELQLRANDIAFSSRHATTVGLIVNELATNAVKHGMSGTSSISFTCRLVETNAGYQLVVANTGRPFPEEISLDNPSTLGLRIVTMLVHQLDGSLELERAPHPQFTIQFPVPR